MLGEHLNPGGVENLPLFTLNNFGKMSVCPFVRLLFCLERLDDSTNSETTWPMLIGSCKVIIEIPVLDC